MKTPDLQKQLGRAVANARKYANLAVKWQQESARIHAALLKARAK